jgi:hypothetical protein
MAGNQAQLMLSHSGCGLHRSGLLGLWVPVASRIHEQARKKVTRPELKIEVDTPLAEAKLKFEDLNRQDAFKRQLFGYATVVAEGSSVKPVGVAVSLFGILGIGAVADNNLPNCCIKNDMRNLSLISTM